jgi:hypothetical protein
VAGMGFQGLTAVAVDIDVTMTSSRHAQGCHMAYRIRRLLCIAFVIVLSSACRGHDSPIAGTDRPAWREAMAPPPPPLPPPTGKMIEVGDAQALHEAARHVRPGGMIDLADGVHPIARMLVIATDGVTLRGKPGRRGDVVLDGGRGDCSRIEADDAGAHGPGARRSGLADLTSLRSRNDCPDTFDDDNGALSPSLSDGPVQRGASAGL